MGLRWWQWGLVALGFVLLAFIAMYVIGALLPVAHTATVSEPLDAPTDTVWALLADVEGYANWRPDVEAVTRLEDQDGLPAWREETTMGAMTFEVTVWDPPRRMVTRIADEGLPFGGSWTYVLEPSGDGTMLTITEDGEVYNPLFRFMSRFIFGHDSTMRAFVDAARSELEAEAG